MDAGGEYDCYTADVTRTFPVSGEFTKAAARLYELCLDVQKEAIEAVKPGDDPRRDPRPRRAQAHRGLIELGLLQGTADERIADKAFRKYYMHRTSHWLGMDVHDVGDYYVDGKPRPLVPGMVLTVEPGLYVAEDDETRAGGAARHRHPHRGRRPRDARGPREPHRGGAEGGRRGRGGLREVGAAPTHPRCARTRGTSSVR